MRIIKIERTDVPSEKEVSTILDHGYYPFTFKKAKKPCYLSQTAGLHRFLILFKDYNTASFFMGSGFSGAKIRRKNEICREKRRKTKNYL